MTISRSKKSWNPSPRSYSDAHPLTLRARASLLEMLPAAEVAAEEGGTLLSLPSECDRSLGPSMP
ncbi:hypothetical protein ACFC4C_23130 [Streptomyces sp. NPDC056039]|uniref:hypothetical protein n=1 Tax=Streptomyces sp. NPDC056039 TaxID=3345687 RepID=UPI0035D6A4C8